MGLDLDSVRRAVDEQVGLGPEAKPSVMFLILSSFGTGRKGSKGPTILCGAEHILLGLLREGEGVRLEY